MKILQLIKELETIAEEHGNLEVLIPNQQATLSPQLRIESLDINTEVVFIE